MRKSPSGPFGTPIVFATQSTVSVNIAVSDDWTAIQNSPPNNWFADINSPDAPFTINGVTGVISYQSNETHRVIFEYAFSLFPLAGADILVDATLDINNVLVGTQTNDPYSQQVSLLGLTANGFPFDAAGYKPAVLQSGDTIAPIFANTVNTDDFTFEKVQIKVTVVD